MITELAKLLGGTVNGHWINVSGPGHRSIDRSLGIKFDTSAPDGFRVKSFANDDAKECRQHVKALLKALKLNAKAVKPAEQVDNKTTENNTRALEIWEHADPAAGTLVEKYLNARACTLSSGIVAADALRFHPWCRFGADRVPAMIALMRHVVSDQPTGIHRTALNDDGTGKREMPGSAKRMLGHAAGAAVKLQPHNGVLGIAEGVETALSAAERFDIPTWALLSAGTIRTCPVIPGVSRLIIFADNDAPGLKAAEECAKRHARAGVLARIHHPSTPKSDWNDFIVEEKKKWQ